jgi:enoyl-CoA hydratase
MDGSLHPECTWAGAVVTLAAVPIHYELGDDHVALITIDRPEARNALDLYHFRDLAQAWRRFKDETDAWVAIITGVEDAFMAGADLKTYIPQVTKLQKQIAEGNVTEIDGCRLSDGTYAVLRNVKLYKPIIAAVNGPCVAGGMEMLGGIDIRIATPTATFGVMEPKRGLFAGGGTTVRLPRQIPFPAAMEFLLTAERFPAQRALELGLINEIVEHDQLLDKAREWAHRITANAPLAVQATKESVMRGLAAGTLKEAYDIEQELAVGVFQSEDAKEGPKAFAEKREPNWQGR